MSTSVEELTEAEQKLRDLKQARDEHERNGQELIDALHEAIRKAMDEEGLSPTRIAAVLGVTRGRVYQFRDRGREKHKAAKKRPRRKSK